MATNYNTRNFLFVTTSMLNIYIYVVSFLSNIIEPEILYKLFEFIIFAIFIQPKLVQTFDRHIILLQIHAINNVQYIQCILQLKHKTH